MVNVNFPRGIPYAYEQLGRHGTALANYQDAARILSHELEGIRGTIDVFSNTDIMDLLELRRAGTDGWLFGADILPLGPEAPYLRLTISSHAFQAAMKGLRDLYRIEQRLELAAEQLQVLAGVDTDQQNGWTRLIEQDREQQLRRRRDQLLTRIAGLQERLQTATAAADGRALAEPEQLALWQRVEHATTLGETLEFDANQRHRLDLYRGLLIWEDSERFPELLWVNTRQVQDLQRLSQQASDRLARLEQTIARRQHSSFAPRIASLEVRLSLQRGRVALAMASSSAGLRRVAVAELQRQARELSRSLGQSQLAIARLYDQGSIGRQP